MIVVLPDWTVPRNMMVFGSAFALAAVFLWRLLFNRAITRVVGAKRVLFLGSSEAASQLAAHFVQHPEMGLAPVGYVRGRTGIRGPRSSTNHLGG